ncbi:MAG: RdgB/HAM1 family non-canonical purine NTP pyrophosphatase [Bacteroidia bacterium]|nr:RdgB/HAM1 family non-canonical purine NTP pyrophosphatase [Bacteroidia bacterium]
MKLLFGTNNLNKLREIREILGSQFTVLSLADLGVEADVEETETTLEGNALLKARYYAQFAPDALCFADDSGLEADALGGAPGVYSARYAGPGCTSADNIAKLLSELHGAASRRAAFRAVIAWHGLGREGMVEGRVGGTLLYAPRGSGGFGYDPLFVPDGYTETFAEMAPELKHQLSHRGQAVQAFAARLRGGTF